MKANKQISNLRHFLNSLPQEEIVETILDRVFNIRVGRNQHQLLKDLNDIITLRRFKYCLDIFFNQDEIEIDEEYYTKQEQINIIYKSYEKKLLYLKKDLEKLYIKYPKARGKTFESIYCSNEYIKTQKERDLYFNLRREKDLLIKDLNIFIILIEYDLFEDYLLDDDIKEDLSIFFNNEFEHWLIRLGNCIELYGNTDYYSIYGKCLTFKQYNTLSSSFMYAIEDIYYNIQ